MNSSSPRLLLCAIDQEAPGRLTAIMGKLQNPRIFDKVELSVSEDFAAAPFQLLAQVRTGPTTTTRHAHAPLANSKTVP